MLLKQKLGKCLGSLLMLSLSWCCPSVTWTSPGKATSHPSQPIKSWARNTCSWKHLTLTLEILKGEKNWNFKPMKDEVSLSIFQYSISRRRCLKGGSGREVYTLVSWVFKPHWLLQVTLAYFLVFSYISYSWSHWISDRWHCRDIGLCSRVLEQDKLSCLSNGKESNNLQN